METHRTLAGAYAASLRAVLADGLVVPPVTDATSVGSQFGEAARPTREVIGGMFGVRNPLASIITSAVRTPNLAFAYAQVLWTLSGSDLVEPIAHYNPRAGAFSRDGRSLPGAFGARLRATPAADQLDAVVRRLRSDPATRRAVATIASPLDAVCVSRDNPCAIALQFLLRDGRLHTIAYMRSQSAAMVLPYDGFLFMAVGCYVAARVGVRPGPYHHVCGSLHLYDDELPMARRILDSPLRPRQMGEMTEPDRSLAAVLSYERRVRTAEDAQTLRDARRDRPAVASGSFWEEACALLEIHASTRLGTVDADAASATG